MGRPYYSCDYAVPTSPWSVEGFRPAVPVLYRDQHEAWPPLWLQGNGMLGLWLVVSFTCALFYGTNISHFTALHTRTARLLLVNLVATTHTVSKDFK